MGSYDTSIISVLIGHKTEITDGCFSPTENLFVSIGVQNEVMLWDWTNGELKNAFHCPVPYLDECSFSPCGSRIFILAAEVEDNPTYQLIIYNTETGQYLGFFGSCSRNLNDLGLNKENGLIAGPNHKS
ncbi:MAG: hypothetical protein MUP70_09275 [Candidatus Aminicenantes bacterium]|nr:hypothetical protein [Candidatus Aminicenantes bacterium]